jgi:hypothetical protein
VAGAVRWGRGRALRKVGQIACVATLGVECSAVAKFAVDREIPAKRESRFLGALAAAQPLALDGVETRIYADSGTAAANPIGPGDRLVRA